MEWNFELEEEWLALTEDDPELLESQSAEKAGGTGRAAE